MNDPVFRGPSALSPEARAALETQVSAWEQGEVARFVARAPERQPEYATQGGLPLKRTYTALDIADTPLEDIGLPGQYPFTRGRSRASALRKTPTAASSTWSRRDRLGSPPTSTCPR